MKKLLTVLGLSVLTVMFVLNTISMASPIEPVNIWEKHPDNPVLEVGGPGSWDEEWVIFPSVIKVNDTYMMWYRGVDDSNLRQIGVATSIDGVTWTKETSNPVLGPGVQGEWDETIHYARVMKDNSEFKMYYTGADNSGTFRIGLATSDNGTTWAKHPSNPIIDIGGTGQWDESSVSGAIVLLDGGIYRMWYAGAGVDGLAKIGYATSANGVGWDKYIGNPVILPGLSGEWDDTGISSPSVVKLGNEYHIWYWGKSDPSLDHIGYATSSDGINWTKASVNPVLDAGNSGEWDDFGVASPSVIFDGDHFKMWYHGWRGNPATIRIGLALSEGEYSAYLPLVVKD